MASRLTVPRSGASSTDYKLPPMPQTLLRATEVMQAADVPEVDEVVRLVEHDPGVVARVLRIANSAYYGQRSEISSVRRAIVVLGPTTVVGLVMSMGMAEMKEAFDDRTMAPFLDIVQHSVATAFIAQEMTKEASTDQDDSPAEAFTGGLLHDIGKLVLLYNHPEAGNEIYRATMPHDLLLEEEERIFGTNHVRVGAAVSEKLRLPEVLKAVISHHHSVNGSGSLPLVQRVQLANRLAHALSFPESLHGDGDHYAETSIPNDVLEHWKARRDSVAAYVDGVL